MSDRYAVVGNPVAHSRSPSIHAQFAAQTGQDIVYERLLAPLDGFVRTVEAFRDAGGRGLNVTVPFKLEAFAFAARRSPRADKAGAVNTLRFDGEGAFGDNTDGIGLVRDITARLGLRLDGATVLMLGAGGAARGVLQPLLDAGVAALTVANRTASRAAELAALAADARVSGCGFDLPAGERAREDAGLPARFDLILNATSAGLDDEAPGIPVALYPQARLCYDMVYGAQPTAFMTAAAAAGCERTADGLGMLVEQAAESFLLWRNVRPATEPVYQRLRAELAGSR